MFQFASRAIGMIILALAVVLAVLDVTRSIGASRVVLTSLAESWSAVSPTTLQTAQQTLTEAPVPFLWDPLMLFVLALPSWLVAWFLAMLLLWLGQPRRRRFGRFASR